MIRCSTKLSSWSSTGFADRCVLLSAINSCYVDKFESDIYLRKEKHLHVVKSSNLRLRSMLVTPVLFSVKRTMNLPWLNSTKKLLLYRFRTLGLPWTSPDDDVF